MRVFKGNSEYQGTPTELAEFFKLTSKNDTETPFPASDFEPLESIVNDSQELRKKLAEDPSYNPFPGISQSKESENADPNPAVGYADLDTGVQSE